ncbi:MAG: HVO_0476 family zinc finger protein [Thermoplasmatota archaeon]
MTDETLLECPTCEEVQEHRILRQAESGWTLECLVCHGVRTVPAPAQERFLQVPTVLSDGASAKTVALSAPLSGKVAIGDEFDLDGSRVRITSIERKDGSHPKSAPGRDIKALYAIRYDTVALRYTVNQGETTRTLIERVPPETLVAVGSTREVQGIQLVLRNILSADGKTLRRGSLAAQDIRRVVAELAAGRAPRTRRPRQTR